MCLGNWLFKELLSSSRCLCLRLWIDLSQQQNHGESQGDSRFQCTSVIPAFPVPPFLSSLEVSFVYQLRKFTFMDYFFPVFLVDLFPLCPCSLPGRLVNCPTLVSVCIKTSGSFGFAENHLLYHICCILVLGVGIRPVLHALTS